MFYVSFNLKKIGRYEFLSECGDKFGFIGPDPRLLAMGLEPRSLEEFAKTEVTGLLAASVEVMVVLIVVFNIF